MTLAPPNGLRPLVEEALRRGRAPLGASQLESDNILEIMAALRRNEGVFAAFGALARDLGRMSGIRRLALDIPLPAIEVRQAVAPSAAQRPAVDALAEFLFL